MTLACEGAGEREVASESAGRETGVSTGGAARDGRAGRAQDASDRSQPGPGRVAAPATALARISGQGQEGEAEVQASA